MARQKIRKGGQSAREVAGQDPGEPCNDVLPCVKG